MQLLEPVVGDGDSVGVPAQTSSGRSLPGGTSAVTGRESAAFQPRRPARCNEGRAGETGSSVDLRSGDRLLLFTDGITEAEGPDGEEFGMEKVAAFAKAHAANSAAKLNQQLLAQVTEFCGAQFQDDATLLVLAVK